MSLSLSLYLIDVLSNVSGLAIGGLLLCTILTIVSSFFLDTEFQPQALKSIKRVAVTAVILSLILVLIPEKKTMYLILGASVAKEIVENPRVQEVGSKVLEVVNQKLDEMSDKKEKKKNE